MKKHYMNSTSGSVLVVLVGRCYGITVSFTNFLCGLCDCKPVPLELELMWYNHSQHSNLNYWA